MKISDWLDEKEAENVDVSQITLPRNMAYDEDPDETIFFKEIKSLRNCSVQKIIPFLRSNDLDIGITVEVKTRKQVFIHQK
jgi:hypothetical protein